MTGQEPAGTWRQGTFFDHLNAAADALGFENIGIAWGLAMVPWRSLQEREAFLRMLTAVPSSEVGN